MNNRFYISAFLFAFICLMITGCLSKDNNNSDQNNSSIPDSMLVRNGMVVYYDFNNNLKDHSGNGNNAIESNILYEFEQTGNGTVYFDGNSNYVKIKNAPSLNPVNAISIAFWFKPVDYVGIGTEPVVLKPFTSHTSPYYQYLLGVAGSYGLAHYNFTFDVCVNGAYVGINSGPNTWVPDTWYFVVAVYDGQQLTMYVNGVLKKSLIAPGTISVFDTDLYLGKQANFTSFTPGTLDNLRIYNRAITLAEISEIYAATAK
jgi:Concanavalin A-like lectin/glucanases superfamily